MSQMDKPSSNTPEQQLDLAAFQAEIGKLVEERTAGIKEWEEFHQKLHEELSKKSSNLAEIREEINRQWGLEPRKAIDMKDLLGVKSEELTPIDAEMWNGVMNYAKGRISKERYKEYYNDVENSGVASRRKFRGVIASKLNPIWMEEELEEILKRLPPKK